MAVITSLYTRYIDIYIYCLRLGGFYDPYHLSTTSPQIHPTQHLRSRDDWRDLRLWKTSAAARSEACAVARSWSFAVEQGVGCLFFWGGLLVGRSKHVMIMRQTSNKKNLETSCMILCNTCLKHRNGRVVSLSSLEYTTILSHWWVAYSNTIKLHYEDLQILGKGDRNIFEIEAL